MKSLMTAAVLAMAGTCAYAYRDTIRLAFLPYAIGRHTVIANCVFDGTVNHRGEIDYCKYNTFNSTGLYLTTAPKGDS